MLHPGVLLSRDLTRDSALSFTFPRQLSTPFPVTSLVVIEIPRDISGINCRLDKRLESTITITQSCAIDYVFIYY